MSSTRYQTALQYIAAFETLSTETFLAIETEDCHHTFAPSSLQIASFSTSAAFAAHITGLRKVLAAFPVFPKEVIENPTENQVLVWATSETRFHDAAKDSGVSEEEWRYKGEYMFVLWMDGSGERINRVVEFLDSEGSQRLRGLMARAKGNLGDSTAAF